MSFGSYPVEPAFGQNGLVGALPGEFFGTAAVDGDRGPWLKAPVGTTFWKRVTDNQVEQYIKVKAGGRNDDWVLAQGMISQRISYSDFTDGGAATGTKALNATIPIGAIAQRCFLVNNTEATGVTTLTIQVGDGTDVDRYTTGTPSVATAAGILDLGAVSGTDEHTATKTPTVTLTEDDDFTDITAWAATVVLQYTGSAV